MNKKDLMAVAIPVLELIHMLLESLTDWLDRISTYDGTRGEYLESRKRMIRFLYFKQLWK